MATTFPAPPERVWPWLVQMGYDRAGWYSWDRLDHGGVPSADRIAPEWQNLQQGQRLNWMAHGRDQMTVAILEPGRTLVLRSIYQVPSFRTVEPGPGPPPRNCVDAIWGFTCARRLLARAHPGRMCGPAGLAIPPTGPVSAVLAKPTASRRLSARSSLQAPGRWPPFSPQQRAG